MERESLEGLLSSADRTTSVAAFNAIVRQIHSRRVVCSPASFDTLSVEERVMILLGKHAMTTSELAKACEVSIPGIRKVLDGLAREGSVASKRVPGKGRGGRVFEWSVPS